MMPLVLTPVALASPPTLSAVLSAVDTVGALLFWPKPGEPPPPRMLLWSTALLLSDRPLAAPRLAKALLAAFWWVGAELSWPAEAGATSGAASKRAATAENRERWRMVCVPFSVSSAARCPALHLRHYSFAKSAAVNQPTTDH